jgi:hypothetical protein
LDKNVGLKSKESTIREIQVEERQVTMEEVYRRPVSKWLRIAANGLVIDFREIKRFKYGIEGIV